MDNASSLVRPASADDVNACLAIYRPYVEDTAITFEAEVPASADMPARVAGAGEHHDWLVLQRHGTVIGYAYACAFNSLVA